jgi:cell division protein FtsI (penicillin-binding protein 3)
MTRIHARRSAPGRVTEHEEAGRRVLVVGRVLVGLITVAMVGLLGRVIQLQTHPHTRVAAQIDTQRSRVSLHPRRGSLLDRRGRELAISHLASRLFVDPQIIEDPNTFSEAVGYRLGYDPAALERKLGPHAAGRYVVIDPRLDGRRVAIMKEMHLRGLAVERFTVREYPQGAIAGQVIGFVGVDGQGLEGLERTLNSRLTGQAGRLSYLRDSRMRPLWVDRAGYRPPADGQPIVLSLDATIQLMAEERLQKACEEFKAQSGQMVVMDPRTGELLAMANYPFFDPNRFGRSKPDAWRNRCVTDVFEPGSTFKAFVWAAATEAGLAKPDEVIDTTDAGYYVTPKGRGLHDVHGHGKITWDEVLVQSSNIGMAIVGQRMEARRMHAAVRAFGFGSPTGSGLPGEVIGLVRPARQWNHYSITSVPIGQEVAVTALQLARGYSAIANGGHLVTPTIQVRRSGTDAVPIYERVLSTAVATHTRRVLRRVVTEGTGRRAGSTMYSIFGKTGTAQVADHVNGGYLEDQYVSSFVGGAPLDEPRVVVVCSIHRPDVSIAHHGGTVAGPAVRDVIEQALVYLGIPPEAPGQTGQKYARLSGD